MKIIKINAMWCPGCLISRSIWNDIEKEYPNNEYISLDYDFDEEEVLKYNVGDILPVVIVMENDKEIKRIIGEKSKKEILDEIGMLL
ncbi:MAG: thioredoxin family protein [Bacilli bacterium]